MSGSRRLGNVCPEQTAEPAAMQAATATQRRSARTAACRQTSVFPAPTVLQNSSARFWAWSLRTLLSRWRLSTARATANILRIRLSIRESKPAPPQSFCTAERAAAPTAVWAWATAKGLVRTARFALKTESRGSIRASVSAAEFAPRLARTT